AVGPASPGPGGPGPMVGPRRRKFLLNELRFAAENARFRPPWTEALVQEVHGLLLGDLGLSPPAGEFRGVPHTRLGARGQPLYETCPPGRIEADLRAMLDWVDRFGAALHPVVPAAVLLHGFQIIRPFPVGNATVGRTMALMYLQSFGMTNVNLVPVSSSISESPELLMRLMLWTQSTGGYTELVDFLLDRLVVAYLSATGRWLDRRRASDQLDEIALRILSRARRSPGWFSPNVASQWVGARSAATVRRHLNELVQRGFLEALGRTRGKRYRIVSSLSVLPKIADRFGGFPPGAPPFEAKSTVESAAPDPESWSSSGGETSP
ncbi:MAG TPA: Fic family protein, partial [Thermoplasmata archaeon]|nr:Fic family protein [Thermoplasmata archaeon]